MIRITNRCGEININTNNENMRILNYKNVFDIDVEFEDGTIVTNKRYDHFKEGKIKNPYFRSINNIGYIGIGKYETRYNGIKTIQYQTWIDILKRCYNERVLEIQPTYKNKIVCTEWHNFQNFAKWYDENYYEIDNENIAIDKDILIKHNKIYSPATCIFVPQSINNLFLRRENNRGEYPIGTYYNKKSQKIKAQISISKIIVDLGLFETKEEAFQAYKIEKEKYIKEIANIYRDKIPEKLYDALLNYKVEITD